MKDAYYFSHDYNARNDVRLQEVLMKMGQEGIGIYWSLVEMLYEHEGYLMLGQCDSIAFALRTDSEKLTTLINLVFNKDDEKFWSDSVIERLKIRKNKSKRAKQSAEKRWSNQSKPTNAKALRTQSEGNAIKERKGKEIKGKEIELVNSQNYLLNIPLEDFDDIEASEKQIRLEGEKALNWLLANNKKKTNHKAFLRNWVLKVYKKKSPTATFTPDLPQEISVAGLARLRKMKQSILGSSTHTVLRQEGRS